jgi:hypothetical protein
MDEYLREQVKYDGQDDVEAVRERWYRIINTYGITINE